MEIDYALLGFIGVSFAAALSGAVFKPGEWYARLARPSWCPPNWMFPVVWTVLFAMIAVSGWMAHAAAGGLGGAPLAFAFYFVQLALNAMWSWLFFGRRRPDLALAEMALLWVAILANAVAFYAITPVAGLLLAPYLVWVSVAFALNLSILRRNPVGRTA